MSNRRVYDVAIAGAGPAGLATALYLLRRRPQLAGRIVAIEKMRHPRVKVCAGGLIPKTITALDDLGLALDLPAVKVNAAIAETEVGRLRVGEAETPLCTIVRRDQFDARIARFAREVGVDLVEDARVLEISQDLSGVQIATSRGHFEAAVLVGADGSGSKVRRSVFGAGKENIGRALMADVPSRSDSMEFSQRLFRFDFNCVRAGISGYCWSFPCLVAGRPHLNVGIYDQGPRNAGPKPPLEVELKRSFPELLRDRDSAGETRFRAFPIRWYSATDTYVAGRTILAGDAAGVDPLLGEGISYAFEHGKLAAEAIAKFLDGDSRALEAYGRRVHHGAIGRKLRRLAFAARRFYGPHHRLYFKLAGLSARAQELGIQWYNGVRGFDEVSIIEAILRWGGAVLFGMPVR
jgi:menaquinone-9 beta-reductase